MNRCRELWTNKGQKSSDVPKNGTTFKSPLLGTVVKGKHTYGICVAPPPSPGQDLLATSRQPRAEEAAHQSFPPPRCTVLPLLYRPCALGREILGVRNKLTNLEYFFYLHLWVFT